MQEFIKPVGQARLRRTNQGLFQIHMKGRQSYEGSPQLIFQQAVKYGLNPSEVSLAMDLLVRNQDDYAEFGIFGSLIYTTKDERKH